MDADTAASVAALRRLLATINAAWKKRDTATLRPLFHDRMIIAGAGYRTYAAGAAACVESYREFAENAAVIAYQESDPVIHVFGDTALAHYSWTMTYRRDGDPCTEAGTDQFVCARSDGRWQVVYRLLLSEPAPAAPG